ncbi:hypothetical protein NYP13_27595, partial [Burkholderia pseudomallei]|nr:hypothetical protein [Burkholderia pseudomallei]
MSDTPLAPPLAPRDAAVIDTPPPARSPEPVRAPQPPSTMPRAHVAKTDERPHREPAIARRTLVETSAPPRPLDAAHGRRPPPAPPARTSITRHRPWPTPSSRRTRHRTTTLRSTFTAAAAARRHAWPTATARTAGPHLDHPASTLADAIIATNAPSHDHSSQHLHRRRSRSTPRTIDSHRPQPPARTSSSRHRPQPAHHNERPSHDSPAPHT